MTTRPQLIMQFTVVTQFAMFACWHSVADGLWRQSYGMLEPAHFKFGNTIEIYRHHGIFVII